jgi:hypothetical protein
MPDGELGKSRNIDRWIEASNTFGARRQTSWNNGDNIGLAQDFGKYEETRHRQRRPAFSSDLRQRIIIAAAPEVPAMPRRLSRL